MMLRRLSIRNFRGIKSCDWSIDQRLIAMVGPGDSAKSTLLDAVGLVLSPNYSPQFTDADFFNLDMSAPLTIEAVITELPDSLVKESQLGKERSGLKSDGTLVHDPLDDAEECLVIRLTVTRELEPTWEVVRPGSDETRGITASQRRQLGFFRLGERPDFHLRWARGQRSRALLKGVMVHRRSFSTRNARHAVPSSTLSRTRFTRRQGRPSRRPPSSAFPRSRNCDPGWSQAPLHPPTP